MATKQKSGLYRTKITVGADKNGAPIYKYISAHTKAELEQKKKETTEYYVKGVSVTESHTFREYAENWFITTKAPRASASSRESYRTALYKDILPVFGDRQLKAIRAVELQKFLNGYAGMSQTKLRILSAALTGVFKSACADGVLAQNPAQFLKLPTASRPKEKTVLTQEQRRQIEQVCKTHEYGVFMALLYYLGCRQGEARGLQWGDFDWKQNVVHIQRDVDSHGDKTVDTLKTKSSDRYIPIAQPLRELLMPLRDKPAVFVLHCQGDVYEPWGKTITDRAWCALCRDAGLAELRKEADNRFMPYDPRSKYRPIITPHVLRHNFITMCYENNIECFTTMKLVGHASYKTTMDIYTHLSRDKLGAVQTQIDDMFKDEKQN